jgi:hypothetical protein
MKNLICFLFCLLILNVAIGQTSNQGRLEELPALIDEAGTKKNYELAARLQDELAIREKIQEVIEQESYEKAAALRKYLYDLENDINSRYTSISEVIEHVGRHDRNNKKNTMMYLDFSPIGFGAYDVTQLVFDPVSNSTNQVNESQITYSLNFKFGHKFYFGPGLRKFRIGVDMNYASLNLGFVETYEDNIMPNFGLSTPSPGVVMTYHINKDMGFDFQTNAGFMLMVSEENSLSATGMGFVLLPQLRYWYNKLSMGLKYTCYQGERLSTAGRIRLNHLGLFAGLRF